MSPGSDKTVSHGWSFIIKVRSITIHSNLSGPNTELYMGSQQQTQITMRRRLTVFFSNHHQHPCHERSLPFLAIQKLHFYISLCNMSGNRQSILLTLVSFNQKNVCDFGKLHVNILTRNQIFWAVEHNMYGVANIIKFKIFPTDYNYNFSSKLLNLLSPVCFCFHLRYAKSKLKLSKV